MILPIRDKFIQAIERQLGFIQDVGKRLRVESDLDVFNPKEDKYIWAMKRGEVSRYFSVYFDDVFVVGFEDTELPEATFLRFFRALRDLSVKGEIILDKHKKDAEDIIKQELGKIERSEKKKRIDDLPESTKEQKMAKEVIKRVNRRISTKGQH
jgi:hypothetical protein